MPRLTKSKMEKAAPPLAEVWRAVLDEAAVSISWSANGLWVAAASASGFVYVYDAVQGHEVRRWNAHRLSATSVSWHPVENILASAGQDGKMRLWVVEDEVPIATLDCGSGWVEHIAWSPSGHFIATACGKQLKLWSKEGELRQSFTEQPNTIAGVGWRADSQALVSACYGQVVFWSPEASEPKRTLFWKGSMISLAWSPDGRYLCHGNQDATVHFWVVAKEKELQMSGYPLKVAQLSWDRRSRFLATAGSPAISVWDCAGKGPRGTKPETLVHHTMPLRALKYQGNGPLLASGCARGDIAVWKPSKRNQPGAIFSLESPITDLAWSPAGRLTAATERGTVACFGIPGHVSNASD